MLSDYNFLMNIEPTDEQLRSIMSEVASDVKERAKKSEELFFKQLSRIINSAIKKHRKQQLD
jgi:hypothetical protein